jgi:hypothetical protein
MKSDAAFLRDLAASRSAVTRFAQQMCDVGFHAEATPQETRPTAAVRMKYGDSGDLMLCGRVEHKVRDLNFEDADSYRYATVIVDEKYKVDRAVDPPLAYVIENRDGSCAAVVYGYTRPHWKVERRWDAKQDRECLFYTIDKKYVRFCRPEEAFYCAPRT